MDEKARSASFRATTANITLANGAILVDEYDKVVFDDVIRNFVVWNLIDKRPAVGDFTNGFNQTATGTARSADKRTMSYSATNPTRAARTPQEIKAIIRDMTLGLYDRSVYAQQGIKFGDLTAKDIKDMVTSVLNRWTTLFYTGDTDSDPLEFNGLKDLLGAGTNIAATSSVVRKLQEAIVDMANSISRDVRPTAILLNAMLQQYIQQEYLKIGDKLPDAVNLAVPGIKALPTAVGNLPLIVDPFNSVISGTVDQYPAYIVSLDKLSWQYVAPLGQAGADPKTFEIAPTNALDTQYKCLMFGALDLLGPTTHHLRMNVAARTTTVDPTV